MTFRHSAYPVLECIGLPMRDRPTGRQAGAQRHTAAPQSNAQTEHFRRRARRLPSRIRRLAQRGRLSRSFALPKPPQACRARAPSARRAVASPLRGLEFENSTMNQRLATRPNQLRASRCITRWLCEVATRLQESRLPNPRAERRESRNAMSRLSRRSCRGSRLRSHTCTSVGSPAGAC